mmetsp:Transcript_29935/g.85810  ORF Transcript_29935/g.85810 Transcript_29935/m.85810 type:complete len:496 (+) Transcript_29935:94-1581(+)
MGRLMQRPRYAVKNTIVELTPPGEAERCKASILRTPQESEAPKSECRDDPISTKADDDGILEGWAEGCSPDIASGPCTNMPSTPSPMMNPTLLPPGMGYLPPFELGMAGGCSLAVPGYNEQGVPGVFIPTMPYDQACNFFLHPGFAMGEEGLLEEDTAAAASIQTELLLEALSEGSSGKHKEDQHEGSSTQDTELDAPTCSELAAWPVAEQEIGEAKDEAVAQEVAHRWVAPDAAHWAAAEAAQWAAAEQWAAEEAAQLAAAEPQEKQVLAEVVESQASAEIMESQASSPPPPREKERARGGGAFGDGGGKARQGRRGKAGEAARLQEELGRSSSSGRGRDERIQYTTVMLRNIPNKYTRDMLVNQLNTHLRGKFDFLYLPIDFKNGCNVGYGFINFRNVEACRKFVAKFSGVDVSRCLPGINNSNKVAEVTPARVQGLEDNVKRLRSSPVMQELIHHPEWMPLVFDAEGVESPLPLPDGPLSPFRPRGRMKGGK